MKIRQIAILLVFALGAGGCRLIDVVIGSSPLGAREDALMDNSLLGKWECIVKDKSEKREVAIYRFNDKELYYEGVDKTDNSVSRGRMFITAVDNVRFFNYQPIEEYSVADMYVYVRYEIANDNVLRIWSLNDKVIPNIKMNGQELVSFIRQNATKSELYEKPEEYRRVSGR